MEEMNLLSSCPIRTPQVQKTSPHRVASRLANDGGDPLVSFSYGVGAYPHDGNTLHQLLAVADSDLYQMKKSKP
jgi:GGDEF domain-containing protein